jgi:mannosyltransferase
MQAPHRADLVRWQVVGLTALAFALRVACLTAQSLWRDEVDALRFATAPWRELLSTFTRPGWNGPLYFVLLRGWIVLTGQSEFALRYASLMFGVATVALAFVLARRLVGRSAAVLFVVFAALSPYFTWYSQESKMYTLVLALVTLAVYALKRAIGTNAVRWWMTLAVATTLAFYAQILAALLIPVEVLLALIWGAGARHRRWWIGGLIALACSTLPYLPLLRWQLPLVLSRAETGYAFYPLGDMLLVMLNVFAAGVSPRLADASHALATNVSVLLTGAGGGGLARAGSVFTLIALWPAALLMLTGLVAGQMRWRDKLALVVWLFLPPLALYLVSLNRPVFTDRYLIWIGPAFYLLVALGAVALWRAAKPLASVTVMAALGIVCVGIYFQSVTPIKADLRGAARYLENYYLPGDLVMFQIPYVRYNFEYYYHRPYAAAEGLFTNNGMTQADADGEMRRLVAGCQRVWLVASEETMWDSRLLVRHWLDAHAKHRTEIGFNLVTLVRYEF